MRENVINCLDLNFEKTQIAAIDACDKYNQCIQEWVAEQLELNAEEFVIKEEFERQIACL